MTSIESIISQAVIDASKNLYSQDIEKSIVQVQKTRKDFVGDYTVVVFPLLKASKKSPEQTANDLGNYVCANQPIIKGFNVIKGFLNLEIDNSFWCTFLNESLTNSQFGLAPKNSSGHKKMVEYSSPNTNKPLHLGHIRNNLLGFSVANLLKAAGHEVLMVNLVNDRGIHICKSMLAWQKFGKGATPQSTGIKGDHLVGDYYVAFDQEYKKQIKELITTGQTEDEAKKNAPIILEAQEMLRQWEAGNEEVVKLWKTMNDWVYAGFDETYKKLGVSFDRFYYESQTYLLGKSIVLEGLNQGKLFKKEDGSIWADLTADGLDQKVLLRSDGTSVYMTQDIGTAHQRFEEYHIDEHVYVVGNEQNYHFQALSLVLKKLGFDWADKIRHLSYGMVELPEGKMKSREGTVVDADDLMDEMFSTARQMSQDLGKLEGLGQEEIENIVKTIGLGALKYFILKVDPKKNMVFDPKESIDFNGNTGPFIQYTHARIRSVMRKAEEMGVKASKIAESIVLSDKEKELVKYIYEFPVLIQEAAASMSPALIANYCYELAKEYNQFYHDHTILKEEDADIRESRLLLSRKTGEILKTGMSLLGIEVPERM